jgi:EmrB/QacA subfamily drug resistance transporter
MIMAPKNRNSRRDPRTVAMVGALLAILLSALDQTIVATAMPQIVKEFQGLEQLSWVFSSYLLASTVTIPIYGKLSDIYGRRTFYLAGIGVFLIGSVLSGQAHSMLQLILFRGIQGVGGGAIMVNSIALIGDLFTPAERGRWQGLIGGTFGIASIAGPLLGGWLTDSLTWRWIFYINLPVGAVALLVLAATLPKIKADARVSRSIDYLGAVTLGAGLVTLLLGFVWGGSQYAWRSPQIVGLFVATFFLLAAFAFIEQRVREPILPLQLFRNRALSVSTTVTFLVSFGMFGAIAFLPLFAQSVVGFSATNSGLALTPLMLGAVTSSVLAGQVISRLGKYKSMAVGGMVLMTIGIYLFSHLSASTGKGQLIVFMVVTGIGVGVSFPIYTIVVQSAFDRSKLGVVTAAVQLFRSIGSTVGIAVMGSLMNNALAERLTNIGSDPFIQNMARLRPDAPISALNTNSLQGFLSPEGQKNIISSLQSVPEPQQQQVQDSFVNFTLQLKEALASSIGGVFFITVFLMGASLLICLLLPVINLHRQVRGPEPQEIGRELEAELGLAEPKDEPEL